MHPIRTACLLSLACLLLASPSWSMQGNCGIRFYGDSTLHRFEGVGRCEPFSIPGEDPGGGSVVKGPRVAVPVASLDTDNSSRDKQMRGMFDSERYPQITGQFDAIDVDPLLAAWHGSAGPTLEFDLTIREVTRKVVARVTDLKSDAHVITFTLETALSLESFGLEAPGVLGIIRVADEVRLAIDVRVDRD